MREAWRRRSWIVDGHNAIFAVDALSHLQQTGERQEARRRLEAWLRPFAEHLARPLCIVYDGNRLAPNPDALDFHHMRTLYSQPPEEADDRIVYLAQSERQIGRPVTVVSNDRRSLAPRLPAGVITMSVEDFFRDCITPAQPAEERAAPPGDYGDIVRHFVDREGEIAREARRGASHRERAAARRWQARIGRPPPAERARNAPVVPSPPGAPTPPPAADERGEAERQREAARRQRQDAKHEQGARRQRRRLEQMARRRRKG